MIANATRSGMYGKGEKKKNLFFTIGICFCYFNIFSCISFWTNGYG